MSRIVKEKMSGSDLFTVLEEIRGEDKEKFKRFDEERLPTSLTSNDMPLKTEVVPPGPGGSDFKVSSNPSTANNSEVEGAPESAQQQSPRKEKKKRKNSLSAGQTPHQRVRLHYRAYAPGMRYGPREQVLPPLSQDRGASVPTGFLGPYENVVLDLSQSSSFPKEIMYTPYRGGPQLIAPMNNIVRRFLLLNPLPGLSKHVLALAYMHKHGLGNISARDNYLFHVLPNNIFDDREPLVPWRHMVMKMDDYSLKILSSLIGRVSIPEMNRAAANKKYKHLESVQKEQEGMSPAEKTESNMRKYEQENLTRKVPTEEELLASMQVDRDSRSSLVKAKPNSLVPIFNTDMYTLNEDSPEWQLYVTQPQSFPETNQLIQFQAPEHKMLREQGKIPLCDDQTAVFAGFINSFNEIHPEYRETADYFDEEYMKLLPSIVEGYRKYCQIPRSLLAKNIRERKEAPQNDSRPDLMVIREDILDPNYQRGKDSDEEWPKVPENSTWYGPKYEHPRGIWMNPLAMEEFQYRLNQQLQASKPFAVPSDSDGEDA